MLNRRCAILLNESLTEIALNKAYSTKALPSGTVLREWRLEEVLGVGGFGIVYKGRGIYFNELVAIKEYFPSSIAERDPDATVVPIDSNAEEVHALGLKKFVEEAKLLWNLSTPSRHPNIVSVRSLFEIHGTAYIVMDFEDGVSLSKLLRQGQRWNERSLVNLVKPIAEGLDRAHRVGVLHRDIKPPNILINDNGRPVLIDFGSARFDTAEATSTTVTFHTPPYAAIEQYVKTFPQGPWTDIYALGVVLYECITGKKPAEVLERMHGGAGQPLSEGEWPGYSRRFLTAVDAAMKVRPDERPQSIPDWLAMLESSGEDEDDEPEADLTRIVPFDMTSDAIVPIAPPAAGFAPAAPADTGVPDRVSKAEFKRAGLTKTSRKKADEAETKPAAAAAAAGAAAAVSAATPPIPDRSAKAALAGLNEKPPETPRAKEAPAATPKRSNKPMLVGAAAVAIIAAGGIGWSLMGRSDEKPAEAISVPAATPAPASISLADLASGTSTLLEEARKAEADTEVVAPLASAAEALAAPNAAANEQGLRSQARAAHVALAEGLLRSAEGRADRLGREVPWASLTAASSGQSGERQAAATGMRTGIEGLREAVGRATISTDAGQSLVATRDALARFREFTVAALAVSSLHAGDRPQLAQAPEAPVKSKAQAAPTAAPAVTTRPAPTKAPTLTASDAPASRDILSPATSSQFNGIVSEGRDMARQVIRMGERAKRGSTPAEQEAYELLRANMQLARTYDSSLAALRDSFRGVRSDRQAEPLIKQARQTRAYLVFLVKRSSDASR
jgi:serine/threonine protein kinase